MEEPAFSKYLEIKNQMAGVAPRLFIRSNIILKNLKGEKGKLLDVGCGEGTLLNKFKKMGFDCIGIDISKKAIELAKKNTDLPVFQKSIFELDKNNKFNVIILSSVLQYIKDEKKFLIKIFDLLVPNGVFIISEPRDIGFQTDYEKKGGQLRKYKDGELEKKLQQAKFDIETNTVWGWPMLRIFIRLFSYIGDSQKDSFKKDKIPITYQFLRVLKHAFLFDNFFNFTRRGLGIIIKCRRPIY